MGSFGERLQREREMRGITLDEIAEATKIGTRALRALEEQEFDKLPGGIFNKGFVRSYARYLGIDEEEAVSDYMAALGEAQAAGKATRPEPAAAEKNLGTVDGDDRPAIRIAWLPVAALVLLLAAVGVGVRYVAQHGFPKWRWMQMASTRKPVSAAPVTPAVSVPAAAAPLPAAPAADNHAAQNASPVPTPAPAADSTQTTNAAAPAADGFLLRVRAKKDAWVLIIADGKTEMSGTLPAETEKAVRARRVVFKTGNAAAIELFHNDKLLPSLGDDKQVRQVTITAHGIQPKAE